MILTKNQIKELTIKQIYKLQFNERLEESKFKTYLESVYYHMNKKAKK